MIPKMQQERQTEEEANEESVEDDLPPLEMPEISSKKAKESTEADSSAAASED